MEVDQASIEKRKALVTPLGLEVHTFSAMAIGMSDERLFMELVVATLRRTFVTVELVSLL